MLRRREEVFQIDLEKLEKLRTMNLYPVIKPEHPTLSKPHASDRLPKSIPRAASVLRYARVKESGTPVVHKAGKPFRRL